MKRILIVGSQHGNELLGERLFAYISKQPSCPGLVVYYLLANPRARQRGVRYIDADMNRSFTGDDKGYEARRAQYVLQKLKDHKYDLIIDAHTTTVDQPACVIVPGFEDTVAEFLDASPIKNIVLMKHEFVQRSLIGNVRRCLSLEVSNSQLDDHLYRMIYQGLLAFSENRTKYPVKRLFEVCDLISKNDYSESEIQAFRNFHRSRQGFYPVLVGEDSYKKQTNYLGFRANSMKRVDISSFVSQSN